ncbi:hypothetical protein [Sphingomonas sp. ID0503]|uniref:hypothetical protein n=1 Tax=Sphingomonas sp. ID0503 TaxID=3399691 RepID=UPI003AFA8CBD
MAKPKRKKKPAAPAEEVYFPIALRNVPAEIAIGDERIIFHGVNKSGSGMITEVLYKAYMKEGKEDQIFSFYQGKPASSKGLREAIATSESGKRILFVDHYLFGSGVTKQVDCTFVSQFRYPLPRVVSCYFWLKKRHAQAKREDPFPSLDEWVRSTGGKGHSQIAQFGLGFTPSRAERLKKTTPEQLFEKSLENIEKHVRWFGIAEHFEESIFVMAHLCGLQAVPAWRKDNRNKSRTPIDELEPETVALIKDVFAYDFKLYDHVLGIFKSRIAGIDFGDSFQAYREACADQYKDRVLL